VSPSADASGAVAVLRADPIQFNRIGDEIFRLTMTLSKNRVPLFGIMRRDADENTLSADDDCAS
jgi:hypothetical protein